MGWISQSNEITFGVTSKKMDNAEERWDACDFYNYLNNLKGFYVS